MTKDRPCRRRGEGLLALCRRQSAGGQGQSDRDAREQFHKPADEVFGYLLVRYMERGAIKKRCVQWMDRRMSMHYDYDPRIYMHGCSVGSTAAMLSWKLGDPIETQALALITGFNHDSGKLMIPHHVLYASQEVWNKHREEYIAIMDQHPYLGYQALLEERSRYARACALIALLHHRHQARRYPSDEELRTLGVRESKLGELAKVLEYVEVGDAAEASDRLYEDPLPREVRIMRLQERYPLRATLIEKAFDGILV